MNEHDNVEGIVDLLLQDLHVREHALNQKRRKGKKLNTARVPKCAFT